MVTGIDKIGNRLFAAGVVAAGAAAGDVEDRLFIVKEIRQFLHIKDRGFTNEITVAEHGLTQLTVGDREDQMRITVRRSARPILGVAERYLNEVRRHFGDVAHIKEHIGRELRDL